MVKSREIDEKSIQKLKKCILRLKKKWLCKIVSKPKQKRHLPFRRKSITIEIEMGDSGMKLAVFYHHIVEAAAQKACEVKEILQKLRAFGITAVEVDLADILAAEAAGKVFDAELREASIGISSIYGFYEFGKKIDEAAWKRHVELAKQLGSERIMIIPGFYSSTEETIQAKEREQMLAAMTQLCRYAASHGIVPTIEDFDDCMSPIATAEQMCWFLERIPELKVAFDTGNFMYSEEEELAAFEQLKTKIVHVHCKDRALVQAVPGEEEKQTIAGRCMYPAAVGSGVIAMEQIVKQLKQSGYEGFYTIEHFGAADQLEYMRASAEWLLAQ